jgi:hypothetical protein
LAERKTFCIIISYNILGLNLLVMFKRAFSHLVIVSLILLASSCIKDTLDLNRFSHSIELTPGLAMPIGYGSLSISDVLQRFNKNALVKLDSAGLLYFAFSSDFFSFPANTAFQIPNQLYNQFFIRSDVPVPVQIPVGDSTVLQKVNNYAFNFGKNERIDSMVVKSGTLQYNFLSSFRNDGNLEIRSQGLRKGGKAYFKRIQVSSQAGNFQTSISDDITGYTIYFQRINDTTIIPLDYKLILDGSVNPLRPSDSVKIDFAFNNLQYKIIYGNIGYKSFVNEVGSIPMQLFNPNFGGNISFVNPTFDISVDNSFGIPIKILLSNVSAFSAKNNITTNITFQPGYNPISIKYPSIAEMGTTKNTIINFDSITPSMATVINTSPSVFNFTAGGYSDTANLLQQNFIADTSKIKATIEVTLPMWFRAGDFSLQDTIALDFANLLGGGSFNSDNIQLAMLRLFVDNGLPIDVRMQVYFVNSSYQVLDSLFTGAKPQIPSASVDNITGKVTSHDTLSSDGLLDNAKMLRIKDTKWALVRASLTTAQYATNPGLKVKFYKSYQLAFKIYFKAKVIVSDKSFNGPKLNIGPNI